MTAGTVIAAVRAHLLGRLSARPGLSGVAVNYSEPTQAEHVEWEAVFFQAEVNGEVQIQSLGPSLCLTEVWTLTVVCQVLPHDSVDDQPAVEQRLADILGEVVAEVASDPKLSGLAVAGWERAQVVPVGYRWESGALGQSRGFGARALLELQVTADRS